MSRKQKRKNHKFSAWYKKPLLAATAFILIAVPTSWFVVHAQSDPTISELKSSSDTVQNVAAGDTNAAATAKQSDGARKTTDAKGNTKSAPQKSATPKSAAAQSPKTNTPSGSTPQPTPSPSQQVTNTNPASGGSSPVTAQSGWHSSIISTVFWVGEAADASNANISNAPSAWDGNWQTHFGGIDDPLQRNGYNPAGFVPNENPFYVALPYNDLDGNGSRKTTANNCPNTSSPISWCKNAWVKITKGNKVAYAQWQDVGPIEEDDTAYVFGSAAPKNTWGAKAGIDVSPAVRDYLGLSDVDTVSWGFVSASAVPAGAWKNIVTSSVGGW